MKRLICLFLTILLALHLALTAHAAPEIDPHAADGTGKSWYQGYAPGIQNNLMTLWLPLRGTACVGDITVSLALDDPNVFLLTAQPQEVTVSPRDGIYPVKLTLALERYRQNGDYPATLTLRGTDGDGRAVTETLPYVIRIRDGLPSHETMKPVIRDVVSPLQVGSDGQLCLTVVNNTTTQSIMDGELTVTDASGDILMSGVNRVTVPEILPGKSETLSIPLTVRGSASVSQHTLEVTLRYVCLGREAEWTERLTVPVDQEIQLERGGVQLPAAIAGELGSMTLPLMNMG